MNKRGLSQVVTTVLIILIVIVAIVIIWAAIRPIFTNIEDRLTAECITINLDIDSCTLVNVDGDSTNGHEGVIVRVTRNAGAGELTGIKFIFTNKSDETDRIIADNSTLLLDELETGDFGDFSDDTTLTFDRRNVDIAPLVGPEKVLCNPMQLSVECVV